ncbi:MAG TPA: acetyl-CoA C-acetyltransferase [Devosia sp.]|nr:acetyl-CoA C-acetyltransferase [Devosia sp.]
MDDVFIVAARRTAIGRLDGGFAGTSAVDLGAAVVRATLADAGIAPPAVSEVILGNVLTAGLGQNPARQTAIHAGIPVAVPAMTINKVCGSGQKAIHLAVQAIRCGDADIIVAGGQENMTRAPHVLAMRQRVKLGDVSARDTIMSDGLVDAFNDVPMGLTAENVAKKYALTREEQDAFALNSQLKAAAAIDAGRFVDEIVPVEITERRQTRRIDTDEHPTRGSTIEALAALRPAFDKQGTVTAGNASGINDGAAAVIVVSERALREHNLTPLARIASYASSGLEPMEMGLGPVGASRRALQRAGWTEADVDLVELNEAFAAQSLAVLRELAFDPARVNVNGGAIALGHPIGASGCRVVVTLLHEMRRRNAKRGLSSLCIGGGMGVALCVEAC